MLHVQNDAKWKIATVDVASSSVFSNISAFNRCWNLRIDAKLIQADVMPFSEDSNLSEVDAVLLAVNSNGESGWKGSISSALHKVAPSLVNSNGLVIVTLQNISDDSLEVDLMKEFKGVHVVVVSLQAESPRGCDYCQDTVVGLLYIACSLLKAQRDISVAAIASKPSQSLSVIDHLRTVRDRILNQLTGHRKIVEKLQINPPLILPMNVTASTDPDTAEIYWEGKNFDGGEMKYLYHVQRRQRSDTDNSEWKDVALRVGNRCLISLKNENDGAIEFRVRASTQLVAAGVVTTGMGSSKVPVGSNLIEPGADGSLSSQGIIWGTWSESLVISLSTTLFPFDKRLSSQSFPSSCHLLLPNSAAPTLMEQLTSSSVYLYSKALAARHSTANSDWQISWTPDSACDSCEQCSQSFNVKTRRHHCRACGLCVCSNCLASANHQAVSSQSTARMCKFCQDHQTAETTIRNARLPPSPASYLSKGFALAIEKMLANEMILSVSLSPHIWHEGSKSVIFQGLALVKNSNDGIQEKVILVKHYKESFVDLFCEDEESICDESEGEESDSNSEGGSDSEDSIGHTTTQADNGPELISPILMESQVTALFATSTSAPLMVFDGSQCSQPFIVTEFASASHHPSDCQRLSDVLAVADAKHGYALPLIWRVCVALEVLHALAFLHNHNIAHLDLHAGNILVTSFDVAAGAAGVDYSSPIKLLGFGASKHFAAYTCEHLIDHFDNVLQIPLRLSSSAFAPGASANNKPSPGVVNGNAHVPLDVVKSLYKELKLLRRKEKNRRAGKKVQTNGLVLSRAKVNIDAAFDVYSFGVLMKTLFPSMGNTNSTGGNTSIHNSLSVSAAIDRLIGSCCHDIAKLRPCVADITKVLESCLHLLVSGHDGNVMKDGKALPSLCLPETRYQRAKSEGDDNDESEGEVESKVGGQKSKAYLDLMSHTDSDISGEDKDVRFLLLARPSGGTKNRLSVSTITKILPSELSGDSFLVISSFEDVNEMCKRGWVCRRSSRASYNIHVGAHNRQKYYAAFEWNTIYERHPYLRHEYIPIGEVADILFEDKLEEYRVGILPLAIQGEIEENASFHVNLRCLKVDRSQLTASSTELQEISEALMLSSCSEKIRSPARNRYWSIYRLSLSIEVTPSLGNESARSDNRCKGYNFFTLENVAAHVNDLKKRQQLKSNPNKRNERMQHPISLSFDVETIPSIAVLKSIYEIGGWKVGSAGDIIGKVLLDYELI